MHILSDDNVIAFLDAIQGTDYEAPLYVALFSGTREGEIAGLTWPCVDFERGTVLICKQLQRERKKGGKHQLVSLKNDKARKITPAPSVMQKLREQRVRQAEAQLRSERLAIRG